MPSLLMRYRIAHSIAQSIMTSVALVVVAGSRCGVAKLRSSGICQVFFSERQIWRQRCEAAATTWVLVYSGFGTSDWVDLATSDGRISRAILPWERTSLLPSSAILPCSGFCVNIFQKCAKRTSR